MQKLSKITKNQLTLFLLIIIDFKFGIFQVNGLP